MINTKISGVTGGVEFSTLLSDVSAAKVDV